MLVFHYVGVILWGEGSGGGGGGGDGSGGDGGDGGLVILVLY